MQRAQSSNDDLHENKGYIIFMHLIKFLLKGKVSCESFTVKGKVDSYPLPFIIKVNLALQLQDMLVKFSTYKRDRMQHHIR
jgi:hypothetical protein